MFSKIIYNLYSGNVDQTTITNTNNNEVASAFPDDFPVFGITTNTTGYLNPEEIKVVSINDINNNKPAYKAFSDPFGDMFDMAAADTLFMERMITFFRQY